MKEKKSFAERFPKNEWIELPVNLRDEYADDIADLIVSAYASKGGNFEIKNGDDLKKSDLNFFIANDVDEDPEIDATLGGKETKSGTKITIIGQDGSKASRSETVKKMINLMNTKGFYSELDTDLADKFNLDYIKDEKTIKNVLNKDINYNQDGTYSRMIAGKLKTKVLVGFPIVKKEEKQKEEKSQESINQFLGFNFTFKNQ